MKKSKELLGLTVISIEDGKDLGNVSDFVINPSKGAVEYLIIDCGVKYLGLKVLPFGLVEGVGEYAVTVQSADALTELAEEADIKGLLEKDVHVTGTRVLSKKGKLIGTVSEFLVDDDAEGKISGCELDLGDDSDEKGIIPAEQIITFGKDILVVNEGVEGSLIKTDASSGMEPADDKNPSPSNEIITSAEKSSETVEQKPETVEQKSEPADEVQPAEPTIVQNESSSAELSEETVSNSEKDESEGDKTENESQPSQAAMMFEQRQRKYLIGRKVTKRIESENGELIAEEGQVVTEELLDRAKQAGKFAELSMNTRP